MSRPARRAWAEEQARAADESLLRARLRNLGLRRTVLVHENRTVLVSVGREGVLRIHRGFAYSSDRVLRAILTYVSRRAPRTARKEAERLIVSFPIDSHLSRRRHHRSRQRVPAADRPLLARLKALHDELNQRHFHGSLSPVRFRISDRMRTRLGEVMVQAHTNEVAEIAMSRRHLEADAWTEVEHTLLHEMIHQWQAETGHELDHGRTFRSKARTVGVEPRANRFVHSSCERTDHSEA